MDETPTPAAHACAGQTPQAPLPAAWLREVANQLVRGEVEGAPPLNDHAFAICAVMHEHGEMTILVQGGVSQREAAYAFQAAAIHIHGATQVVVQDCVKPEHLEAGG